jgi:hypothetical protein
VVQGDRRQAAIATLVAAFGPSRRLALNIPTEDFGGHARHDEQSAHYLDLDGKRVSYHDALQKARPGIGQVITSKKMAGGSRPVSGASTDSGRQPRRRGSTPAQRAGASSPAPASLDRHPWQQHCRGLFQTPIAA